MDFPPDPKAWGGGYIAPVLVHELGVSTLPDYKLSRDLPASYKFEEGSSRVESSVSVVLLYDRAYRYHVYNSYGVLCGIGTVCIAIWCLPIMELGSRLSLDVTLLLVAVAFKQVLSAELPPVSYLTILDYYALTTILFVFVATWLHALVGNLADQGVAEETIYLVDQCAVVLYATLFALYNLWHSCYVHTQLFVNELMTHKKQLTVYGYLPAQIGTIGVDGKKVENARDGSSIFGKYADRPTTVQPDEVVGVMALLMSGFSRAEAMDKMEAKMAEAIRRRWATTPSMFTVLMATTRRWPNMNLRGKHSPNQDSAYTWKVEVRRTATQRSTSEVESRLYSSHPEGPRGYSHDTQKSIVLST